MIDYGDLPTGMTVKHESGSEVDEIFTRQVEDFDCMDILIVLMCQLLRNHKTSCSTRSRIFDLKKFMLWSFMTVLSLQLKWNYIIMNR